MSLFSQNAFRVSNPAALNEGCGKCRLYQTCDHPKMGVWGEGAAGLMFITSHPDAEDDDSGEIYSGARGNLLRHTLRKLGFDAERGSCITYAVGCKPEKGRPTGLQINYCRPRLWKEIKRRQPRVIATLSQEALEALIGHRWPSKKDVDDKDVGYARWMGYSIPDRQTNSWIVPIYSPTDVLKKRDKTPAAQLLFRERLEECIRLLRVPLPNYREETKCVEVVTDVNRAMQLLHSIYGRDNWITIDYETTGLKPFRVEQKVFYVGIGVDDNFAFSFPLTKPNFAPALRLYKKILADSRIGKVAHNMSYEDLWSREKLGVQVQGWLMDTQSACHIDNQASSTSGLKFQAYVRFGLIDYSSHISPYLKEALNEDEELLGANKLNRISQAPPREVMKYCAIDCLCTYRLAKLFPEMGVKL